MFTTPAHVKDLFKRNMSCTQRGMCPLLQSKICHQISAFEFKHQKQFTTNQSLGELMTFVIDNLQMTLKEKEERLKLFQKHHYDIFIQQFPTGQL